MKTLKFKTNINCNGCIANVSPALNKHDGIESWEVNIADPRKILTVKTDNLSESEIVGILMEAGYKAETI